MRVAKKVLVAVLILCMMLQINGAAVIADDAANSKGIEKRGTVALDQPPFFAQVIFQLLRVGSTGCLKPVKIAFGLFPPYGFLFSGFVFPFIY